MNMDWWWQTTMILGMFVLRLGVPLAVTLLIGYWLHRLDAKWQAEAQAQWEAGRSQPEPVQSKYLEKLAQPCWQIKGCDAATRSRCPAAQQPHLPCWVARRSPDGQLMEACYNCDVFLHGQSGRNLISTYPRSKN